MLDVNKFHSMRIGLASPEKIRAWSHGEVTKPETINYRTLKPERDGLFCERIFGPTKDWECHCGKYKRIRYKGVVCDKCGVEVTRSKVRRDRRGSIELAAPVSHIWYFKGIPCRMGAILDIGQRALEKVLYFASYIVLDPGDTNLTKKQLLTEAEYQEKLDEYGPTFRVGMGAEAIKELLHEINVEELTKELRAALKTETSLQKRRNIVRRLDVCEAFLKSGNKPEWMIMDVIPVIPPDLRPMVQLDGGRFATSDLNDLYRRVINRNNRLKRLQELQAPDIIVRNEKRMLQEAVDALIDNGRRGRAVTGPGTRPLKSLSDMLKGKQGRFRQNLLGKRVDYSGRSVIVVGPEMKMHQCGLPKEMALELFKPFVMKRLVETGAATNIKSAKRMVERATNAVWDVLEDVIKEPPVLLNRAPTLHRLGIQAFEPILSEGRAIKLHPLVCTPYNADFDGDQMAVHLPLSAEAQAEARVLMMSVNNILAPKDGKPITVPTQDMVLGAYYLTIFKDGAKGEGRRFISFDEARLAYFNHVIDLQARIKVKVPNAEIFPEPSDQGESLVTTSMGNIIYNCELPVEMRYYSKQEDGTWLLGKLIDKKELGRLVAKAHKLYGNFGTARVLDIVKKLGYDNACKSGLSIAASDIKIPKEKASILAAAEKQVDKVETIFNRGLMSDDERYRKVIAIWDKATEDVANALMKHTMDPFNPVYMMANSGARGNVQQIRQLAGMRGLMADPSGRIIDRPIKSNFREGLTILEYFISSHGARKGLTDTALRTADSGYLTRRLVDVAQDVIVREDDCDVTGMNLVRERARFCKAVLGSSQHKLKDYAIGRTLAASVMDPEGDSILAEADTVVTEEVYDRLMAAHILEISLYPADEESGEEPETLAINVPEDKVKAAFREHMTHHFLDKQVEEDIVNEKDEVLAKAGDKFTADVIEKILEDGTVKELKIRNNEVDGVYVEAITSGKNKSTVLESLRDRLVGRTLAEDIADKDGKVIYHINDYITEDMADVIADLREKVKIRSVLTCKSHFGVCRACYGRNLATAKKVEVGEAVGTIAAQAIGEPGTQLTMRTFHTGGIASASDITQGLPRVEELFEARKPKSVAVIAHNGGLVSFDKDNKGVDVVKVDDPETGDHFEHQIVFGSKVRVHEGDLIQKGTMITEGSADPSEVLLVNGELAVQEYLIREVQMVYRTQGVDINDKHIEVIVRQMMKKVRIEEPGDTDYIRGMMADRAEVLHLNEQIDRENAEDGGSRQKATYTAILQGITKASLATDSFMSAASFQETTRVLTEAAIKGKIDPLQGLKENVIIGKLIPAGTGLVTYTEEEKAEEQADEANLAALMASSNAIVM
ncbi:DNA-directed RNA polymerase subunit beta' [Acidaminococcus fermentans]|uniref:DNA-directed RNA polymerase subunit beta' n=1 Tax=Acidaminococcus fermentans TaxID=905 RepID=UPI0024325AE9|nr:DNA-directed RNA polymerase subunit beta' [Acidaminococcus fermentans]MDD6286844.1 DNA-directed RNA polymerase subunit beta' [Acidaminococcus fermentans]